jgi:hypothetical protein
MLIVLVQVVLHSCNVNVLGIGTAVSVFLWTRPSFSFMQFNLIGQNTCSFSYFVIPRSPKVAVEWLVLLPIRKVSGSDLNADIGYPY